MVASPAAVAAHAGSRLGSWVVGLAGVTAVAIIGLQPWRDTALPIGLGVLLMIAVAGAAIIMIAATMRPGGVCSATIVLGATVLAYAVLLGAEGTRITGDGGSGSASAAIAVSIAWLAHSGHVVPLVLIGLLPVLGARAVAGAPSRWWVGAIIGANAIDVVLMALAQMVPAAALFAVPASSALWLAAAGIGPIGTWLAVRGTTGQTRRRVMLAAIASVLSILILAFCAVLGLAERALEIGLEASVALLMLGFSSATVFTAWLVGVATGGGSHRLLATGVLERMLAAVLTTAAVLVSAATALAAVSAGVPAGSAVLLAVGLMAVAGLGLGSLYAWAARIVDPVAELRGELAALGDPADGTLRLRTEQVLRRLVDDPSLVLLVRPDDGAWLDSAGRLVVAVPDDAVVLARSEIAASVPLALAFAETPAARRRLRRFGDCTSLMWATVLEGEVARERRRAEDAAAAERDRMRRDLHDGLQSRLLGIALTLQLGGRESSDPAGRLLIEETVAALRGAAEEARRLAEGGATDALAHGGLRSALDELVGPLTSFVSLELPDVRFPAEAESTAYFVVGEAVGNALKHGRATHVHVHVEAADARSALSVVISDDGVGGADPRAGSGLRRLAERVAASGGLLVVREAVPHGTVVEASLPCVW